MMPHLTMPELTPVFTTQDNFIIFFTDNTIKDLAIQVTKTSQKVT